MRSSVSNKRSGLRIHSTTALWLTGIMILYPKDAHAYIDPETRSVVIQVFIGVFLALGITAKRWWPPLKRFVSHAHGKEKGQEANE